MEGNETFEMNNIAKEDVAFAEEYQKEIIDNNLALIVSPFMDFSRMYAKLFMMESELDEVIEYFDFQEWFSGGTDKDIHSAEYHISLAEKRMENLRNRSWKKVCKCVRKMSKEDIKNTFGVYLNWDSKFELLLFDFIQENENFPYSIDEAYKLFLQAAIEVKACIDSGVPRGVSAEQ